MKVRLKRAVWFQGELHENESVLEVSDGVCESWIQQGIAEAVDEQPFEQPIEQPIEQPKKSRKKK